MYKCQGRFIYVNNYHKNIYASCRKNVLLNTEYGLSKKILLSIKVTQPKTADFILVLEKKKFSLGRKYDFI